LFHSLGAATANARSPKSVTCAGTTRSPRVADRLGPVTGLHKSAMYRGASPWIALNVSRHSLNLTLCNASQGKNLN